MASPSYEELIKENRRKCCSFIKNIPPIFPQESQINNSQKSKHIIKNTIVSISFEFVPCESPIPRKGYSNALGTTKGVKQVKPYCLFCKGFPFQLFTCHSIFHNRFSYLNNGSGWNYRLETGGCSCTFPCVRLREFVCLTSHQPQDWWDLLTLMSRAPAVPAQLTNSLCTLLMFSVRVQGRQEEVLWNHQLWLCNVLFACLRRALQKLLQGWNNWSGPSSRGLKLKDREKSGHYETKKM